MGIEITKFKPTDRASAEAFNQKQEEIEVHLNNIQSQLDGIDTSELMRLMLTYDNQTSKTITREIFNNPAYMGAYIGDINFGTEVGLPTAHNKVIYIPHRNNGYGTQIAIPFDSGVYRGFYIRNAIETVWGQWAPNGSAIGQMNEITDANIALENLKVCYPRYNACANLPRGTVDDGVLIPFIALRNNDGGNIYGFQLYATWHNKELWFRPILNNNFLDWLCLVGGDWSIHKVNDNTTVGHYLRWQIQDINHVVFEASKGIRPDGQACSNHNAEVAWAIGYPNLMGFNGINTYGLRVDSARWADSASGVVGFQFRNNNGYLEVLEQGVWKRVTNS